jgi:pre-mRNA cleavage complex 2 protein Pcf11
MVLSRYRPRLLSSLYEDLGPPCTQCGRRFKGDDEGKKRRMAHMDWHFRVHQRIAEAEKRGQHRSWYVDIEVRRHPESNAVLTVLPTYPTQDWSNSRETIDIDLVSHEPEPALLRAAKGSKDPKLQYIAVPDPSSGINSICPICQEKFENKWLDSAQEWVWLDAVLVGNRAYHASCHVEATRDREATPVFSRNTPEPVLGKRKAEVSGSSDS